MREVAPVIIPTLNRKSHLERCLDSLGKNGWAKYTDVYISVDFPPDEKYLSGYEEVRRFLENYNGLCFRSMKVLYQEKNLGPSDNTKFLKEFIRGRYKFYIFSEDDNEFSVNFLEYMNKCFEVMENSRNIIAVCGAKDAEWAGDGEIIAGKLFAAYGVGLNLFTEEMLMKDVENILLDKGTMRILNLRHLFMRNRCLYIMYIKEILCRNDGLFWKNEKELNWCDTVLSIYMHLTDKVCIVPGISKARTWGNDGTGVNMAASTVDVRKTYPLDDRKSITIEKEDAILFEGKNYRIGNEYMHIKNQFGITLRALCLHLILAVSGYNRERTVNLISILRRLKIK